MIRHMRSALLFAALACMTAIRADSQIIDASSIGDSVDLSGDWHFRWGDDARWAQPDFDDSGWRTVSTLKSWSEQGIQRAPGFFWYRARVKLPGHHGPLSFFFGWSPVNYELYANGKLIGKHGSLPPHVENYRGMDRIFSMPESAMHGTDLTVAIRFWMWPIVVSGAGDIYGGISGPRGLVLGTPSTIEREYQTRQSNAFYAWLPRYSLGLLFLMLGVGLLVLYRFQSENSEYLWLALYSFAMAVDAVKAYFLYLVPMTEQAGNYWDTTLTNFAQVCLIEFAFRFLRRPMPRWMRFYQALVMCQSVLLVIFYAGWISAAATEAIVLIWNLPYYFVLPGVVLWQYRRGYKEAGLLVIPLFLIDLDDLLNYARWSLYHFGLRHTMSAFVPDLHVGPVPISVMAVAEMLFVLSVGALLLYRFQKTSREQARASAELAAARSIQEVMLPKEAHSAPAGFDIETVYLPAQEVGGDFFQFYGSDKDSILLVIGDVSGKGMNAAMLVSLILGLLRRIIKETREPARVLSELNQSLTAQMDGRFATCCCALLARDGTLRIANAGHLSPYCDGHEVEVPGGLPLGLSEDISYEEVRVDVRPGARLVFLSDGVVEARNRKSGELYGFDRTRIISLQPAERIADDAQRFGQEDDITVIGISAAPTPVLV